MNKKFCILGLFPLFLSVNTLAQTHSATFTVGIKIVEQCKIETNIKMNEKISVNCGKHNIPYKVSEDNIKVAYEEKEIIDKTTTIRVRKIEF